MRGALCVLIGLALGVSVQFFLRAQAAPSDVVGSPNVAVDVYKNRKGTFILWSNGRITKDAGTQDLGSPYRAAPEFPEASKTGSAALGSPNVAVKAIPRGDGTFILFSDGSVRKPGNDDAAAPGGGEMNAVWGVVDMGPGGGGPPSIVAGSGDFTVANTPQLGYVTFDTAFSSPPAVSLSAYPNPGRVEIIPGQKIPAPPAVVNVTESGFQPLLKGMLTPEYMSGGLPGSTSFDGFSFIAVGPTD